MINELLEPRYFSLATGYAVNLLANTHPGDGSKCRAPSWRVAGKSTPPPIETRLKTPRVLMSPDDAYFNGADKRAVNASPRMCAARSSGDTHRPKYPPEPVAKGSCRKGQSGAHFDVTSASWQPSEQRQSRRPADTFALCFVLRFVCFDACPMKL